MIPRFAVIIPSLFAVQALAQPLGLKIIEGTAQLSEILNTHEITVSDRAILHWSDFSIQENERTVFIQPTSEALVLNRVTAPNPSLILGALEANGKVLLLNPNGILFGQKAQLRLGGLVASTLDIQDSAYLESRQIRVSGSSLEKILNQGQIFAKNNVSLIGFQIENRGHIETGADCGLIACNHVQLDRNGALLSAEHFENEQQFSYTVHNGTVNGENVHLLGQDVRVDTGKIFGKNACIGGSFQGLAAAIPNSLFSFVGENAIIDCSSKLFGDGGQIVIWSDGYTEFFGQALSKGGAKGGNGGFIEVSGLKHLNFQGRTSTTAPLGDHGELLLDPLDLTINQTAVVPVLNINCSAGTPFTPTASPSTLQVLNINAALLGGNVTITTVGTVGGEFGDITFQNTFVSILVNELSVNIPSGTTLTINAERDFNLAFNLSAGSACFRCLGGRLDINANRNINIDSPLPGQFKQNFQTFGANGEIHLNALNDINFPHTAGGDGAHYASLGGSIAPIFTATAGNNIFIDDMQTPTNLSLFNNVGGGIMG